MNTEFGYRIIGTAHDRWHDKTVSEREAANWAKRMGYRLIAREVSDTREVAPE